MSIIIRGETDLAIESLEKVLAKYEHEHPSSEIELYRRSNVSIHTRIVDPDFKGISLSDRHDTLWRMFEELPEETQSEISVILLLTPEEKKKSFASVEFDDPVPLGI